MLLCLVKKKKKKIDGYIGPVSAVRRGEEGAKPKCLSYVRTLKWAEGRATMSLPENPMGSRWVSCKRWLVLGESRCLCSFVCLQIRGGE